MAHFWEHFSSAYQSSISINKYFFRQLSPAKRPEPEIRPQLEETKEEKTDEKQETVTSHEQPTELPIEPKVIVKTPEIHDSLVNSSETRPKKKKRKKKPR